MVTQISDTREHAYEKAHNTNCVMVGIDYWMLMTAFHNKKRKQTAMRFIVRTDTMSGLTEYTK